MIWTTSLLATAVTLGFGFLIWISLALLDEWDTLRFIAKGNFTGADYTR